MAEIEKLLSHIGISNHNFYEGTACWEWLLSQNTYGYGKIWLNKKTVQTHRLMFEYYCGSICPDLTINHLCRNRNCCNPIHLEQISNKENVLKGTGISAINAKKTHCIHSHEFTPDNTYITPDNKRNCKTCRKISCQKFKEGLVILG